MKKILIVEKRKKAKELRAKGWSLRKAASHLVAGKDSISKWDKMSNDDIERDERGWKKGRLRVHTKAEETRIIAIRKDLEKEESFFFGADVIMKNYEHIYGESIKKWYVERVLRENGLTKKRQPKVKGRSKYMLYPADTLRKLGKTAMSMDFIGPKFLTGKTEGIHFLALKYIRPKKYGIVQRVSGQTTDETIRVLTEIWKEQPIPDVLKVDNDAAFGANSPHKESIGRLTIFLLNLGVAPLYTAPRNPWNNGEVEGFNSIFATKFWNRTRFNNEEEVDVEIKKFNFEYEKYSDFVGNNPEIANPKFMSDFKVKELKNREVKRFREKKIYFLRIVRRQGEKGGEDEKGFINILGKNLFLDKSYINLFTFNTIDLEKMVLCVKMEKQDGCLEVIEERNFTVKNVLGLCQV